MSYGHAEDLGITDRHLRDLADGLPPRERDLIYERYGLRAGYGPSSWKDLAASRGITPERARQIANQSLQKLGLTPSARRQYGGPQHFAEWWADTMVADEVTFVPPPPLGPEIRAHIAHRMVTNPRLGWPDLDSALGYLVELYGPCFRERTTL